MYTQPQLLTLWIVSIPHISPHERQEVLQQYAERPGRIAVQTVFGGCYKSLQTDRAQLHFPFLAHIRPLAG